MTKKTLIAANWKMHAPPVGWDPEDSPYRPRKDLDVIVFPALLDVHVCLEKFLTVGGQYARPEQQGAFTGDVSMRLLAAHGCTWVLCGHSERRLHHGETDAFVAAQAQAAIDAGLHPIICVGENADERDAGKQKEAVERQMNALSHIAGCVIAYEPVWAIGTGKNAEPKDAQIMHAFIRGLLPADQKSTRILYGGSVKQDNAARYLQEDDVDGLLVGTSSLDAAAFRAIIESAVS